MVRTPLIAARASAQRKADFAALAAQRGITESALLTLLVDTALGCNPVPGALQDEAPGASVRAAAGDRMTLRLRPGDRFRIEARARARHMKPSSYLVALVHAHVRHQPPLPQPEPEPKLDELKRAVAQLSALGRHLERLGRDAKCRVPHEELLPVLHEKARLVQEVRRGVAEVVKANLACWKAGNG